MVSSERDAVLLSQCLRTLPCHWCIGGSQSLIRGERLNPELIWFPSPRVLLAGGSFPVVVPAHCPILRRDSDAANRQRRQQNRRSFQSSLWCAGCGAPVVCCSRQRFCRAVQLARLGMGWCATCFRCLDGFPGARDDLEMAAGAQILTQEIISAPSNSAFPKRFAPSSAA